MPSSTPSLAVPVNKDDHILGPDSAPITLVEYGDFECPACGRAYPAVHTLLERFGENVRFAYRHFPLEQLHPHAESAAEAAEAAGAQGQFWPMYHLLFENQQALEPENLIQYALEARLDLDRFAHDMDEGVYAARVEEHVQSGVLSGVHATPTFFVNGDYVDISALGFAGLVQAIEARLHAKV
jgi:protein-disulfide isomerase